MKIIYTRKGEEIFVDDEDYDELSEYTWRVNKYNYAVRTTTKKEGKRPQTLVLMHRQIMNAPKGMVVDHIDHNKLNNQKNNLRICTDQENAWNRKVRKGNVSGVQGVRWDKKRERWGASISVAYNEIYLGSFTNVEDAAKARKEAEIEYYGEFRCKSIDENLFKEASKRKTKEKISGHETLQINNTSGVIGVSFSKSHKKWRSYLEVNKKRISLGYFENFEDAVRARLEGEMKYLGKIVEGNIEQC